MRWQINGPIRRRGKLSKPTASFFGVHTDKGFHCAIPDVVTVNVLCLSRRMRRGCTGDSASALCLIAIDAGGRWCWRW